VSLRRTIRRCCAVFALTLAIGGAATPLLAAPQRGDFTGEVPGVSGKTWIDLLSQVFLDIAAADDGSANASDVNDLRSIGSGDDSWVKCGDHIHLLDRDARPIRLAGSDYTVVTVTIEDECVGLIALFDSAGKLIDAVNVRGDVHVSFSDNYVRPLGAGGALVIAHNWHDNSAQSYDADALILAKPDGLSAIGSLLAFGERVCDGKSGSLMTEESKITVKPDGQPFARIGATIERRMSRINPHDCETKIGSETATTFTGYWSWNPAKGTYEPHTQGLDALDKWNEKHF